MATAACTSQPVESKNEGQTEEPTAAPNHSIKNVAGEASDPMEGKDGTVISFEEIEVKELNPALDAYEMMYWSEGVEAAAYVTVPKKKGYYYLSVLCHGGYVYSLDLSNVHALPGVTLNAETLIGGLDTSSEMITLSPLYRGYGNSKGTVPGFNGVTKDTNNAIDALYSYFRSGNTESSIRSGFISASGISLGGGVVLKLASMRDDIGDVVAVNPYVGLDLVYPWAESHPENDWNKGFLDTYQKKFGEFDPSSTFVKEESIPIERNFIPILIVQGQKDQTVNWELTQSYYEKLKEQNQNEHTAYKLIPDGDHLMKEHQDELNQIINDWYVEIFER
ncbi:alpha/beta hydrolase [Bacillus salacetis]|uniref:Alpha/beta hydrolase n=1 Tax=Bacillus salacetis TaxID=2315464 RepID=A0A3A1QYJ9_9BACI|nr:prolyl oligopeptidase family serine peptidase [Bacillus salacetis]RIW30702.1 alpha/beta hydrolase [Bacillus salacetis]